MAFAVVTSPLLASARAPHTGPIDLEANLLGPISLHLVGPDEDVKVARGVRAHPSRNHLASAGGQGHGRIVKPGLIDLILPEQGTAGRIVGPDEGVKVAGRTRDEPGRKQPSSLDGQGIDPIEAPGGIDLVFPAEGTARRIVRPHQEILVAGRALTAPRGEDQPFRHGQGEGRIVEPGLINLVFPDERTVLSPVRPDEKILVAGRIRAKSRGEHQPVPCRKGDRERLRPKALREGRFVAGKSARAIVTWPFHCSTSRSKNPVMRSW